MTVLAATQALCRCEESSAADGQLPPENGLVDLRVDSDSNDGFDIPQVSGFQEAVEAISNSKL